MTVFFVSPCICLTEQFEHETKLLCTVISYDFLWKVSRVSKVLYMPDIAVSYMRELDYS